MVENRLKRGTYGVALLSMNLRVVPGLVAWLSCFTTSPACGPFFPDTVLDSPQSALEVPPVSYLAGLYRIAGKPVESDQSDVLSQIPLEVAELEALWEKEGLAAANIASRVKHYIEVRTSLLTDLTDIGMSDFPIQQGPASALPERPLGEEFPAAVADYVEGARLYAIGQKDPARNLWKGILAKPAAEKKLRSVWAAWMLAKTSADLKECLSWYERVETEAKEGGTDVLRLSPAAKAWRAPSNEDPIAAMHDFYDAFVSGKASVAVDLRRLAEELLGDADPTQLAAAAADPLVRRLINLHLHASFDDTRRALIDAGVDPFAPHEDDAEVWKPDAWLAALEAHAPLPMEDGARIAWALYASGHFEEARHWLDLSVQDDPLSCWLQAKFDLRSGNLDAANQHLAEAIRIFSAGDQWHPRQPGFATEDPDKQTSIERETPGKLLADAGIVALAREDYSQALESLRSGGFEEDAAYLAERVLSTEELIQHVRNHAPQWQSPTPAADRPIAAEEGAEVEAETAPEFHAVDPAEWLESGESYWSEQITPDNRLRWQLARRLAREDRLREAREFMPPGLLSIWDRYLQLDIAWHDEQQPAEARAAIGWQLARIHRHWGAELFSTDTAPDGGIHGWDFEATDLAHIRSFADGWALDWEQESSPYSPSEFPQDQAIPIISRDELRRVEKHPLPNTNRFHYRYVAAQLAWEAASLLPDNHPQLALLYNTAGQWLAARDPQAADRFYQAMVKRCKETDQGKAADTKRWFLQELEPLNELPGFPEALRLKKPSNE